MRRTAGSLAAALAALLAVAACTGGVGPSTGGGLPTVVETPTQAAMPTLDPTPTIAPTRAVVPTPTSSPSPSPSPSPAPASFSSPLPSTAPGVTVDLGGAGYSVTGSTVAELRGSMIDHGLHDDSGDLVFGITEWEISWSYAYAGTTTCRIDGLAVTVDVTVTLPDWRPPATADAALIRRWTAFIDAMHVHERQHVVHAIDGANEVRRVLNAMGSYQTCEGLEAAADQAGDRVLDAIRARDLEYDRTTGHGTTQGAVW